MPVSQELWMRTAAQVGGNASMKMFVSVEAAGFRRGPCAGKPQRLIKRADDEYGNGKDFVD